MGIDLGSARGRIEIDTSGVFKEMQAAGRSIKGFQSEAALAMVGVGVAIAGVTKAVALMKKGWDTFERGADLKLIEERFTRLSDSIGSSGDVLLSRLKSATNGMMSSAQLMSSATDIMSLGLGKTEDQTVRLATVVGKLGWDMQQVILTFANNSKMRLDALGLSVEDVTTRAKELEKTGLSMDAAFDMAVIEAGEAKIQLLGDQSETTAGKIKVMKAAVQEVNDQFARGVAEGFAQTLDGMSGDVTAVAEGFAQMAYGLGLMTRYTPDAAAGMEKVMSLVAPWALALREAGVLIGVVGGSKLAEDTQFDRAIASADAAMLGYADTLAHTAGAVEDFAGAGMNVNAHLVIAGERFKEAAAGSGKFGAQLDGLKDKAAAAQAALDAAAQRAESYAAAFGAVQADYVTELPNADEPLVAQERTVNVTTRISGPTAEQTELAARYTDELERLQETYVELTGGVGTFGMEQDKLDERIAATSAEIAYYQGLLGGIPPAVDSVSTSQQGLAVNVDAVKQGIYNQLVQMEAAPEIITAYASATGIMSEAQAEAVLQAAAVKVKIEELATAIAEGMPIDQALADLDTFIQKIETGVNPATEGMGKKMNTSAVTAGEGIPTGIATGINDTLEEATTAATDAADAVTQAVRDAHGVESPSTVFAEIGGQDIAGFIQGVEDATGEAVGAMENVAQATTDAWDDTIAAADQIGASIIDGVIAGVEAKRGELVAKMQEIAREAYEKAMAELQAKSPSRLFMNMGEAIITGIMAGLDAEKDTLYGRMTEIAGELYRVATSGLAWLGEPLEMRIDTERGAIDTLGDEIEAALGQFGNLGLRLGADVVDRLRGMNEGQLRASLYGLRYSDEYRTTPAVAAEVERLIGLAEEREAAEQSVLAVQEELAAVEARRLELEREQSRLAFLNAQIDLVDMVRELGLSTAVLEGLELGLDANADDLVAAMQQVIQRLIEAAEDELEIASPSRVGYGLTENFMEAMTRGITENSRAPVDALAETYDNMLALNGRMGLAGLGTFGGVGQRSGDAGVMSAAELRQSVNIYGGLNVSWDGQPKTDPLRELFFANLGYQRG